MQIHKPFFRLLGVKNDFTVSYSPDIFYSEGEHDDDDIDEEQLNTIKTNFNGLDIKETVPVDQEKSYFKIKVNGVNQWRSQEFLSLGQFPDNFFLRMGNIGQFKIYWAIF